MLHGIALRYFVEVARTGSLAAASQTLHVAVSAISRQIGKLEEDVGTPLFERMPRGMVLTESGERLAAHARRALLEGDAVLAEIAAAKALGRGIVRVGCTEGFTRSFLPSVLARHHAAVPHVQFMLRAGTPAQVEHWVAAGEVDLGLAFSGGDPTKVRVEYTARASVCALLNPAHPLAQRASLTLADLRDYPVALLERGNTARQLLDECCARQGVQLAPILTSNNSSALHAFAALANAITLGSRLSLAGLQHLSDDLALVARPIDEPELSQRSLCITTMRERRLSSAIESVLKALIEAIEAAS
ncbi:LysR family transcriptional regulator [Paraburkholderia sp. Ac-20347]|jgi:DNA-binding transcriptional LysR family regulator|uniref:LysR family transcriptional regulator n=1 Tax=Paraburkholderia sp. Ac-20347 TaxID=2703892 RepID=UPI00197F1E26|nr:LysR family transcriptional regulator [Paraburkholderia sp. Ac-20347]MBN3812739.1 LysR family transcriptional regulator [Paraburkholderia sp. Ac-20347]